MSNDNSSSYSDDNDDNMDFIDFKTPGDIKKYLTRKEIGYYKIIDTYFKQCPIAKITKMIDIIEGKSEISLRILDWVVTKYAKDKNIIYEIDDEDDEPYFNVYIMYKSYLGAFRKKYFDAFRRQQKIMYYFNDTLCIVTTIGQLNFFRWVFRYNILDHIESKLNFYYQTMNKFNKEDKKRKATKKVEKKPTKIIDDDDDDQDNDSNSEYTISFA